MERRSHWQQVYASRKPDEVSWFQAVPERSLQWIEEVLGGRKDTRILDVGAGASVLVDHLLARGFHQVAVLDVAPSVLEQVRRRLEVRAEQVEWFATDLLAFSPPHRFDLWHDRAVLHFLRDPEEQKQDADVLRRTLEPDGYALIATFAVGGPTRCSGLDIVQYDVPRLLRLLGEAFYLVREEQEVHRTPGGSEQLFHYFLVRQERP